MTHIHILYLVHAPLRENKVVYGVLEPVGMIENKCPICSSNMESSIVNDLDLQCLCCMAKTRHATMYITCSCFYVIMVFYNIRNLPILGHH